MQGTAAFRDAHTLEITGEDGKTDDAARSTTRSSPPARVRRRCPGLSIDSPRLMDSTGALELPDIPKSLLVVGGGYIGLELGSVYAALGTKVTVVEMTGGLLPGADRDLVNILAKRIEKMCEAVLLNTKVVAMKEAGERHRGHLRGRRARRSARRSRRSIACWSRSAAARTARCRASTAPGSR